MHLQGDIWSPTQTDSFFSHRKAKPSEFQPAIVIQNFIDSSLESPLAFPISASFVRVKFVAWNPLAPLVYPAGSSVLWLECDQLASVNSDCFAVGYRSNIIASWNIDGTYYDGTQPIIEIGSNRLSKLKFTLKTNTGRVPVTSVNGVVISLEFYQ
jgi:hypothetical protein